MRFADYFFDFDGTLCDTDADIRLAWKAALLEIDAPRADFDAVFRNGPSIDEVARRLFGPEAATPALIEEVRARFRRHYDGSGFPNTRPYPGAAETLRALKDAGKRVFVATNKRLCATNLILDALGWRALFDGVYASDMFREAGAGTLAKPALLAEALRREAAPAASAAMVGDTANDFDAAHANGLFAVGCPWGYGEPGDLARADASISSFPELLRI